MAVIEYVNGTNASADDKIRTLRNSVQMALNNIERQVQAKESVDIDLEGYITQNEADRRYELKGQGGSVDADIVEAKTTAEWLQVQNTYVPKYGAIIVYVDYITEGDINGNTTVHPAFKVGNGAQTLSQLPFVASPISKKLTHVLTIGAYKYDGSEDVSVPVYDGDYSLD